MTFRLHLRAFVPRLILITLMGWLFWSGIRVWNDIQDTARSVLWPTTGAEIIRTADPEVSPWNSEHREDKIIEYRYSVGNRKYHGSRVSFSRRSKWTHAEVRQLAQTLLDNSQTKVSYDPSHPEESVLQPGGSNAHNLVFFTGQCLLFIGLAVLLVLDPRRIISGVRR